MVSVMVSVIIAAIAGAAIGYLACSLAEKVFRR
jgi:hypothetical protein